MLETDNYVDAEIFLTPPKDGMCSDEDSDKEETVSANHLSGSQLSAQAHYRVNYGHLVSDSMLEESNFAEIDEATTSSQQLTDENRDLNIDPLLFLPPPN